VTRPTKTWKDTERTFAAFFGSTRNALSGGNSGITRSDSRHERLFIETKQRRRSEVATWFRGARESAMKEGKTPLVGLHMTGTHQWLIVCDVRDLPAIAKEYVISDSAVDSDNPATPDGVRAQKEQTCKS